MTDVETRARTPLLLPLRGRTRKMRHVTSPHPSTDGDPVNLLGPLVMLDAEGTRDDPSRRW